MGTYSKGPIRRGRRLLRVAATRRRLGTVLVAGQRQGDDPAVADHCGCGADLFGANQIHRAELIVVTHRPTG
jgi:hypothetical protein